MLKTEKRVFFPKNIFMYAQFYSHVFHAWAQKILEISEEIQYK